MSVDTYDFLSGYEIGTFSRMSQDSCETITFDVTDIRISHTDSFVALFFGECST